MVYTAPKSCLAIRHYNYKALLLSLIWVVHILSNISISFRNLITFVILQYFPNIILDVILSSFIPLLRENTLDSLSRSSLVICHIVHPTERPFLVMFLCFLIGMNEIRTHNHWCDRPEHNQIWYCSDLSLQRLQVIISFMPKNLYM